VLQKCLKRTSQDILSLILIELETRIHELMIDSYANYFCQKFFAMLSDKDKMIFLNNIKENVLFVSNNKIGTYPLQIIIEQLRKPEEIMLIINSVKEVCMDMFYDSQGCHVIEKMIICFDENLLDCLYELILNNFMSLANNVNGLCLTKKIIVHAKNETTIMRIQQKLVENCISLVQNTYGNYSIQTVFDSWDYQLVIPIMKQFFGKMSNLSMQKFSSNVVEKCLEKGGDVILSRFVEEIYYNNKIAELMKNSYGNYVVQKALKLASDLNKKKILDMIIKNIDKIGEKKLIMKWKMIVQSFMNDQQGNMYNNQQFSFDHNPFKSPMNNDYYYVHSKNI